MPITSPDNEAPSNVTGHPYQPPAGRPEGLCTFEGCHLGEAVHSSAVKPYVPEAKTYRCPNCVTLDIDPCEHQDEDMRTIG
jgi:hypothetical protein